MIKSLNTFYKLIDSNKDEIKFILENINFFYYEFSEIKYNNFGMPKFNKDGSFQKRYFNPTTKKLKDVQNKIQFRILANLKMLCCIKGGVKGNGNIDNADIHKSNTYFFQTDLKNFFPSVSKNMVYNSLITKGFSSEVAFLITELCLLKTHDSLRNFSLPQGAPTSPMLANIVFEKIDLKILKIIENKNIKYTRWLDDLTFSSKEDFRVLNSEILSVIYENGFKISRGKTTYRIGKTIITGVKLKNGFLKPTEDFENKDENLMNERQIIGRNQYRKQVNMRNVRTS